MRSRKEIRDQLRQAKYRALQKRLRTRLKEIPSNCGHNEDAQLAPDLALGMCTIHQETGVRVCDVRVPGCVEVAQDCAWFVHAQSKDDIKREWAERLGGDRGVLAYEGYGDIVALAWVLDERPPSGSDVEDPPPEGAKDSGPSGAPEQEKKGFWSRVFGG